MIDSSGVEVLIAATLSPAERLAALAHELIHLELGPLRNPHARQWGPVVAREERRIDREVAARLCPADQVAAMVKAGPVEVWEICERFGVPERIARLAQAA